MRQAINNLQSTWSGFSFVSGDNVFKVCDQPHPIAVQSMMRACSKGDIEHSMAKLQELWDQGYSAVDIIVTIFRVVKTFDEWVLTCFFFHSRSDLILSRLPEYTKLEYIKVSINCLIFSLRTHTFMFRKSASHI
jgi:replication factor C subunit 2/4